MNNNTQVKICGITNLADAQVAVDAGADLLGFIFYPKSPRYVEPAIVAQIIRELRLSEIHSDDRTHQPPITHHPSPPTTHHRPAFVGVFVTASLDHIQGVIAQTGLDYAQLHGDEAPQLVTALNGRAFKALRPQTAEEAVAEADRFGPLGPTAGPQLLVDAYDPHAFGGTGRRADWVGVAPVAARYRLLLAGGLTPENVTDAIHTVHPWGVDVSSGVEAKPGRKDHGAVRAFLQAVKGAA